MKQAAEHDEDDKLFNELPRQIKYASQPLPVLLVLERMLREELAELQNELDERLNPERGGH